MLSCAMFGASGGAACTITEKDTRKHEETTNNQPLTIHFTKPAVFFLS